jgi:hypothetical protein
MDKQKIFKKVAIHLLTQGKKSQRKLRFHRNTVCAYRGYNNLKCAIGCLIPDKLYSSDLEGCSVRSLPTPILKYLKLMS